MKNLFDSTANYERKAQMEKKIDFEELLKNVFGDREKPKCGLNKIPLFIFRDHPELEKSMNASLSLMNSYIDEADKLQADCDKRWADLERRRDKTAEMYWDGMHQQMIENGLMPPGFNLVRTPGLQIQDGVMYLLDKSER